MNHIIFDFDGVIVDSVSLKGQCFYNIFPDHSIAQRQAILDYHNENGGVSRLDKIKYFFSEIANEPLSQEELDIYMARFSELSLSKLKNKNIIIQETLEFIKKNKSKKSLYIASASDHQDLIQICDFHSLSQYFKEIRGGPTSKTELIATIMKKHSIHKDDVYLIGDSKSDIKAARNNNIKIFGYNNPSIKQYVDTYINNYNIM